MFNKMYTALHQHRVLFGSVGAVIAVLVASIYLIVVPEQAKQTTGIVSFTLRYAHSICWVLIAASSTLWAADKYPNIMRLSAYSALVSYLAFMSTLAIASILT